MEKRNYILMIDRLNDGFGDNGWADGFADLPSDHQEIANQLFGKVKNSDLIYYIDEYLQGYELGNFMSEECENIYDEDGFLKEDEYVLDTFSHLHEAKEIVIEKIKESKSISFMDRFMKKLENGDYDYPTQPNIEKEFIPTHEEISKKLDSYSKVLESTIMKQKVKTTNEKN